MQKLTLGNIRWLCSFLCSFSPSGSFHITARSQLCIIRSEAVPWLASSAPFLALPAPFRSEHSWIPRPALDLHPQERVDCVSLTMSCTDYTQPCGFGQQSYNGTIPRPIRWDWTGQMASSTPASSFFCSGRKSPFPLSKQTKYRLVLATWPV